MLSVWSRIWPSVRILHRNTDRWDEQRHRKDAEHRERAIGERDPARDRDPVGPHHQRCERDHGCIGGDGRGSRAIPGLVDTTAVGQNQRRPAPFAGRRALELRPSPTSGAADGNGGGGGHRPFSAAIDGRLSAVRGRCHARDRSASIRQRTWTAHPTGATSTGGGSGAATVSLGGGAAATSSARRPSGRMSGVPQRLQAIAVPNSDHFQHVGQQSCMSTAHSQQSPAAGRASCEDGAGTVTGSAQTEI